MPTKQTIRSRFIMVLFLGGFIALFTHGLLAKRGFHRIETGEVR